MQILVVNAGSSSLKLRVLDGSDVLVATSDLPRPDTRDLGPMLDAFFEEHAGIDAAGHRVVHGGSAFQQPMVVGADADTAVEALADLAPLHNPQSLAAIEALQTVRPDLPQVACFDTAFHAGMPAKATTYAVPGAWRARWDIRRFGFHGLSHAWSSRRAGELLGGGREQLRLVTAHLGAGASLAAVAYGRSVDTTMGFTPMEGLVMGTRSGSVDPGLILWVQRHGGLTAEAMQDALEHDSGLRGLSGVSGDLRRVLEAADLGDRSALLAYEVFVYRIQTGVGAMTAAMGGIDGLVFTGGAGEASPRLRADVCASLGFLGLRIDAPSNESPGGDPWVSVAGVGPPVVVVETREDLEIARHVRELLA